MIQDPAKLVQKYRSKGLLLDANLLLLYVVGLHDPSWIGRRKLSAYTATDLAVLRAFVEAFSKLVTTAHILTEVSNLLNDWPQGELRTLFFQAFAANIARMQEEPQRSGDAALRAEFPYLGLTDCVIANLAERFFVLSSDARMVVELQKAGLEAVNFNYFRSDLQQILRVRV